MRSATVALLVLAAACTAPETDDRQALPNSAGKADAVRIRFRLTDSNPLMSFSIGCDQPQGCEGFIGVDLITPEPCALFPAESGCGMGRTEPLSRDVLTATITSTTEGERILPLTIESGDGDFFTTKIAAAFSARAGEEVEVSIAKLAGTPDLTIDAHAEWTASADPGGAADELNTFLSSIPGLTFQEVGTGYPGYRAFTLQYEQPLDHDDPAAGTFQQSVVLHHRDKAAPMVLFTSGYSLFSIDYLSELGEGLQSNHLSTEQRYFGTSMPPELTPESYRHVNIEQAAKDHHRLVEALRPFYAGSWLSTGHSKGGMTSVFHRRFFPEDVDATVAYVAPISYADPDPRYVPFLDAIGEEPCRESIRRVQRSALEQIDQLLPLAEANSYGSTFERAGGHASAFEKGIVLLEWLFWQHAGVAYCAEWQDVPTDPATLYATVAAYIGSGLSDDAPLATQTYYYQAATELGKQQFATAHLADLLQHEDTPYDWSPPGTNPTHDPSAMVDVQSWVTTDAHQVLFLYGEYDPWTGGAYEVGAQPDVVKLTAPKATHAAMIKSLADADRELALRTVEQWVGTRPNLGTPMGAPRPVLPRLP